MDFGDTRTRSREIAERFRQNVVGRKPVQVSCLSHVSSAYSKFAGVYSLRVFICASVHLGQNPYSAKIGTRGEDNMEWEVEEETHQR